MKPKLQLSATGYLNFRRGNFALQPSMQVPTRIVN